MESENIYCYDKKSIPFSLNSTVTLPQTRKASKNFKFVEFKKRHLFLNDDDNRLIYLLDFF